MRKYHKWIMIVKHIPVSEKFRPEQMGIYPSWPYRHERANQQKARIKRTQTGEYHPPFELFGQEPDYSQDRFIHIGDEKVVIHSHEYSLVTKENLNVYINGSGVDHPSHFLVQQSVSDEILGKLVRDSDLKSIYEAALLDGASAYEAYLSAVGVDIVDDRFPPIGWYRLRDEYKELFGL